MFQTRKFTAKRHRKTDLLTSSLQSHNYAPLLYYHVSFAIPEAMPTVEDYTYPTVSKICRGNEKLMSTKARASDTRIFRASTNGNSSDNQKCTRM